MSKQLVDEKWVRYDFIGETAREAHDGVPNFHHGNKKGQEAKIDMLLFRYVARGKNRLEALASVRAHWLRTVNNVRTIFERQNGYIYIPDLRAYANS